MGLFSNPLALTRDRDEWKARALALGEAAEANRKVRDLYRAAATLDRDRADRVARDLAETREKLERARVRLSRIRAVSNLDASPSALSQRLDAVRAIAAGDA